LLRHAVWARNNREQRNEASRRWNTNNKDKKLAAAAAYRAAHQDKINARRKAIRAVRPELERLKAAKRRAHKQNNGGKLSRTIVATLLIQQKGVCACCAKPLNGIFHLDHKIPLSRGGQNTDDNVQLLLPACNLRKYTMTPEEFATKIKELALTKE